MITSLKRVDPERRVDRRYTVAVQPTLLDEVAVICAWGSCRSRFQRFRILPAASLVEANLVAERIVRQKLHRGYKNAGADTSSQ